MFIWLTWLILGAWQSWRQGSPHAWLPALILPLVLLAPWEWRNYKVFHAIIPVRTNFGLELGVSNSPFAKVTFYENFWHHYFPHPNADIAEARKVLAVGEVKYTQQRMQEALQWIRTNPRQALGLWIRRFVVFWFPTPGRRIAPLTIDLATALSCFGLFVLARASRMGATLCAVFLVIYPPVYYILQAFDRYRFPILWVTFGLAAAACSAILEYLLKRTRLGAQWNLCPQR
jgi:hypothetical protein